MIRFKIDNIEITVPENTSVLEAARSVGIGIPSMCYLKGHGNHPSCMICIVKDKKTGLLQSSCALRVSEGMEIISEDEDVTEARKEALDLLISDHVGDCEAPCSITCPAGMNIPLMNRLIASGQFEQALKVVQEEIALPYILGYICPAPCEKACRRKQIDEPVSICLLKRFTVAAGNTIRETVTKQRTRQKVAIIGTGPAGLASAFYLLRNGYPCVLIDKNKQAGGNLRNAIPENELPRHVLDAEIDIIQQLGAEFRFDTLIDAANFDSEVKQKFDAVIIATGDAITTGNLIRQFDGTKTGIQINTDTYATSMPGVFACGNVIRSQKMAVRSAAQGKSAALAAIDYIQCLSPVKSVPPFNSRFDKLLPSEYTEYMKDAITDPGIKPFQGIMGGFTPDEAVKEAARCMHCDCRKPDTCKLRIYATQYQIDRKKYVPVSRKPMTRQMNHEMVVYEPEKCIRCGLCIDITLQEGETLGLTYVGRGFDVRIGVPFCQTIREALTQTGIKCVESCPTGALAFKIDY